MFLARVIGLETQVYPLIESHKPKVWRFISYGKGAAAIAQTRAMAIVAARRELAKPAMQRLYVVKRSAAA